MVHQKLMRSRWAGDGISRRLDQRDCSDLDGEFHSRALKLIHLGPPPAPKSFSCPLSTSTTQSLATCIPCSELPAGT